MFDKWFFGISAIVIALIGAILLQLATVRPHTAHPANKTADYGGNDRVAIVTDQEAGVTRFMIDGREVAWFDATGFYVNGDIAYEGTITDGLPAKGVSDAP